MPIPGVEMCEARLMRAKRIQSPSPPEAWAVRYLTGPENKPLKNGSGKEVPGGPCCAIHVQDNLLEKVSTREFGFLRNLHPSFGL